jgi:hypothetical protein
MTSHSKLTKEDYYLFLHDRIKVVLFSIWLKGKLNMPTKVKYDNKRMIMYIREELASFVMHGSKVETAFEVWLMYCKAHDYMIHVNGYGDRHVLLKNEYIVKTEAATVTTGGTKQQQDEQGTNTKQLGQVMASRQNDATRRHGSPRHQQVGLGDGAGASRGGLQGKPGPVHRDAELF